MIEQTATGEVTSTFRKSPAYRYIRRADKLPTYAELGEEEAVARVKLFNPTGAGTWWIASYDPDTEVAFGVAEIQEREIGSFSIAELVAYRGRFSLPIERDIHFKPTLITAIVAGGSKW